jgi:hypothetical protein
LVEYLVYSGDRLREPKAGDPARPSPKKLQGPWRGRNMSQEEYQSKTEQLSREFELRYLEHTGKSEEQFQVEAPIPEKPVRTTMFGFPFKVTLEVDLRFKKGRIVKAIKKLLDDIEHGRGKYETISMIFKWRKANLENVELHPHYSKRIRDDSLELYRQFLQVWDLREREKKSWSKIVQRLPYLQNIDMARDYYKAAKRCVEEGPPFGPSFADGS